MTDHGQALKAGEVILSGALGPMVPIQAGDLVQVHISALGHISMRISA
jgi:2-keto-4-pentenoate hydratase